MPEFELKDVRPPVDLPADYSFLFFFFGVMFLVGVFSLLRWLWPKLKKKKETLVVQPTAWQRARELLEALEKEDLPGRGEVKEYFTRLSGIVRHYLEDRFSVAAPEMTTDEFLTYMKNLPVFSDLQKQFLKDFLTASDMVKFAKHGSSINEMTNAFKAAVCLVEETIPQLYSGQTCDTGKS